MNAEERRVRAAVYRIFAETSRAPTLEGLEAEAELGRSDLLAALRSLADQHCLVLEDNLHQLGGGGVPIRMAMPFSGRRTSMHVRSGRFDGFANCAWDALGVPVALEERDADVAATCPVSGEELRFTRRGGRWQATDAVVHFAVPARSWWEDIGFT